MLSKQHLITHTAFLNSLHAAPSKEQQKHIISKASYQQLRTLIRVFAAVILKKIPIGSIEKENLEKSRRKTKLKKTFSSFRKVRQILKKSVFELRLELIHFIPALQPVLSAIYKENE